MSCSVNRHLENKDMDRIDHALGRPVDPLNEDHSYRNHFATDGDSERAMFRASPLWNEGRTTACGMTFFHVNAAGRKALSNHLSDMNDRHRLYAVSYHDGDGDVHTATVPAKSRSEARYNRYLEVSDFFADLKFMDFCKRSSVRLA
jgi:hypothetical protein